MKKKQLNENPTPAASPVAPQRNIGQDFSLAKKTLSNMLQRLGKAFNEYESRMADMNMALQSKISPLSTGASSAQERIAQLEADYEELQKTSKEQLDRAEQTIAELRRQMRDAATSGAADTERLRIANAEVESLTQTVADKSRAIEDYMARLEKARERIRQSASGHEADRQAFASAMDAYEAQVAELKKANEELRRVADEATEKFNTLLGGVTTGGTTGESTKLQGILQKYRNYGSFDLIEHLERAKKKSKKSNDW